MFTQLSRDRSRRHGLGSAANGWRRALRTRLPALLILIAAGVTGADDRLRVPLRAEPLEPPDGEIVGALPLFQVGYSGIEDAELRHARFRIVLSRDRFHSEAYVFDQRERRAGWLPGEPGRILYRPRRPLEHGTYQWRVSFWNGVRWVTGQDTFELRVDTVPPAEVEDLQLLLRRQDGAVELSWEPVTLDAEGGPEFVARYHVYRYTRGPPYPLVRPFEIGTVPEPSFLDPPLPSAESRLVLYRVTAEDQAGNRELRAAE